MKIGIGHNLGFHDHAFVELPIVECSGNYGAVQKFGNFHCKFSILFEILWQNFMNLESVII